MELVGKQVGEERSKVTGPGVLQLFRVEVLSIQTRTMTVGRGHRGKTVDTFDWQLIGLGQRLNIESEEGEYLMIRYLLYHYLI